MWCDTESKRLRTGLLCGEWVDGQRGRWVREPTVAFMTTGRLAWATFGCVCVNWVSDVSNCRLADTFVQLAENLLPDLMVTPVDINAARDVESV